MSEKYEDRPVVCRTGETEGVLGFGILAAYSLAGWKSSIPESDAAHCSTDVRRPGARELQSLGTPALEEPSCQAGRDEVFLMELEK